MLYIDLDIHYSALRVFKPLIEFEMYIMYLLYELCFMHFSLSLFIICCVILKSKNSNGYAEIFNTLKINNFNSDPHCGINNHSNSS